MTGADDGRQVYALRMEHYNRYRRIAIASAHPLCVSLPFPSEDSVQARHSRFGNSLGRAGVVTGSGRAPDPSGDDGTLCGSGDGARSSLSYLEGDRLQNSIRVSPLSLDVHDDNQYCDTPVVTRPSVGYCRPIASLSSPRRSVAFSDFKFMSQPVAYACQRSVSPTLSCSCFISETEGSACAFADLP